jgi:hypothetical protein
MNAHQAIASDPDFVPRTVVAQQLQVKLPLGVLRENRLLAISTLRDVMPAAGHDNPCDPCHSR